MIAFLVMIALIGEWAAGAHSQDAADSPPRGRPVVGAIRWDAWIGDTPGSDVGRQVERSLAPPRWHVRLPFFAREISANEVQVRANRPEVMDREISFAHAAGLDYWAFVMYRSDDPLTRGGLDLYLHSGRSDQIKFAMIVQPYTFDEAGITRLLHYFADRRYQTVAGGRALVFLAGPRTPDDPDWPDAKAKLARLRADAAHAGLKNPYIVHLWGWDSAKRVVDELNLDAISAYSMNFDDRAAPFSVLARKTEAKWDEWRATGAKVLPIVTAGWDRRPRVEHPVSWEGPSSPDAINRYYESPTPEALAQHLKDSLDWCARYPTTADAQGVLIYAWNEIDEGGWLVPSLWRNQGSLRLDAIGRVLRTWRP